MLVSTAALQSTGTLQPGALVRYRYKIDLDGGSYDAASAAIKAQFPDAGWQVRSPRQAAANLTRYLDIFDRFLLLVGLSSLMVGGIGVSNAAAAYIGERERSIATMRSLGATGRRLMVHFLAQIMVLGLIGTVGGMLLGAVSTLAVLPILGGYLSILLPPAVFPLPLLTAAAFGTGDCVCLCLPAARCCIAAEASDAISCRWRKWRRAPTASSIAQPKRWWTASAWHRGIDRTGAAGHPRAPPCKPQYASARWLPSLSCARWPGFCSVRSRLLPQGKSKKYGAHGSAEHLPARLTPPTVVLSLGLGLTLMLSIALIEANVRDQLQGEAASTAPSFVLMNLSKAALPPLTAFASADHRVTSLTYTPLLRGIISKLNGTKVSDLKDLNADQQRRAPRRPIAQLECRAAERRHRPRWQMVGRGLQGVAARFARQGLRPVAAPQGRR